MNRFYWLDEGMIAGCSRPGVGSDRQGDENNGLLDHDLTWLGQQNIAALLSLTETPLDELALRQHGFESLHLPVRDLTAPAPDQLMEALTFIDLQRAQRRAVAVHCLMGQGRTATVLAAYLIRGGVAPEAALVQVRGLCPGAVGSPSQERALHAFAERRDWVL